MRKKFITIYIFIVIITKLFAEEGCALGIFIEGGQKNLELIKTLEKKIGKKFSSIMWYLDWSSNFPTDDCNNIINNNYIPHITWEPWYFTDNEKIHLIDIVNGEWDEYITQWAHDIKKWGHPIILRCGHEFNGNWYPWCISNNGMEPKLYIKAYKHIHDIFTNLKANNVIWLWSPNTDSVPDEPWNDILKAYPGDEYVDWVSIDGYNFGSTGSKWMSFNDIFKKTYNKIITNIKKPIMIGEFACSDKGGNKHTWIIDMDKNLKNNFPGIKAIYWFNIDKETDWRLESDSNSLRAAKKIFTKPYYISNISDINMYKEKFLAKYDEYLNATLNSSPSK